ncbi:hypothetical protein E4K67_09355 [Desulfosporosinus fructosivorans]|uniref:Uncharacterized protein n=1 Tax=Desulfosporosinus fructosivorans TaxID=2018669 RepID=A0A4Z0R5Q9_9FIRM|nr:hypothetical protein [Desulfosporosinus fructosivorans]TGE38170.1 hypothetical protein E4K67_09355 [Desulfosporosinus fructosivorans]
MEKHRQALLDARGKILGKLNSETEHRIQWLMKFIDIEDELEELAHRQSQWTIKGKLTSSGDSRRRIDKYSG